MKIGVWKETHPGERRVALVPDSVPALKKLGLEVLVAADAGVAAGHSDQAYVEKGASIAPAAEVAATADALLMVRAAGASANWASDVPSLRKGQVVLGLADPLGGLAPLTAYRDQGVTLVALELIPRITRAQSMDVLSSMATVAGYRAVLLAAEHLPKMFPMLMTAAGTIAPARVFVIGCGVAGLQACATAKRLGAVVRAYDVRPAVKEQVESVGAQFVALDVAAADAEDAGGYAKAQDESFYERQRAMMHEVVRTSDVVITTAAIPGKAAPVLVTEPMVNAMRPGSVVVDLAAERGGNCAATVADEVQDVGGVTILGPTNPTASVAFHASQMFSNNVVNLLRHLVKDAAFQWDAEDEITAAITVTRDGAFVHPRVAERAEGEGE